MSKSILSKVAAVACSVASVIALGVCASAEKLEVNGTNYDLDTGKVNLVATKNVVDIEDLKAAEYKVQYDVEVANNTGFAPCGVRLVYDKSLEVVPTSKGKPGTVGAVGKALMAYLTDNPEEYNVAIGCSSMENTEENGVFFSVEFKVPSTAKVGDKIPLKLEVDKFLDENNKPVAYNLVDGYIEITGSTTAPVTTTTAAPTTSATVPTTSATVPTTSATVPTTSATVPTTSATVSNATTTTTSAANNGTAAPVTTTAKPNTTAGNKSTTKAGATQTGDTGAGVAVAALLLAAGTAVAAAKKKED